MCNRTVRTYSFTIQFVLDRFKSHEKCDKAVNTFVFDSGPDWYMTKELCGKGVSEDPFMLKYCPDKCKTQEMCDKAVDFNLLALKFVPDYFVTNKMIEKLDSAFLQWLYKLGDLYSDFVTFFSEDLDHNIIIFDNINLDDEYFNYCDPDTINHVKLMGWYKKHTQRKSLTKR